MSFQQIVKFATNMGHAWGFLNAPIGVKCIEARVGICLQDPRETFQVLLGMFATVIRRVRVPHCRCVLGCRPADHREHTSISGRFWFDHSPELVPAREYHRRVVSHPPLRNYAEPPPEAELKRCSVQPTRPTSSDPAPLLLARKSLPGDRAVSGHCILRSTRGPAILAPPGRDQWDGSVRVTARCTRNLCSSALAVHARSHRNPWE